MRENRIKRLSKDKTLDIKFYMDHEMVQLFTWLNEHLLDATWADKAMLVRTAFSTGLRIHELVRVRVEDCFDKYVVVPEGKGGKARFADFWPEFGPKLFTYLEWRGLKEGFLFHSNNTALPKRMPFCGNKRSWFHPDRLHITERGAYKWWKKVIETAGLRFLHPHCARKTYATWAAHQGVKPADLMACLGHRDYKTTLQHYQASIPGQRFTQDQPEWRSVAGASLDKTTLII